MKHLGLIQTAIGSFVPILSSFVLSFLMPLWFDKESYSDYRKYLLVLLFAGVFHFGLAELIVTVPQKKKITASIIVGIQLVLLVITLPFLLHLEDRIIIIGILTIPAYNIYYLNQTWLQGINDYKSYSKLLWLPSVLSVLLFVSIHYLSANRAILEVGMCILYYVLALRFILQKKIPLPFIDHVKEYDLYKRAFTLFAMLVFINVISEGLRLVMWINDEIDSFADWSLYSSLVGLALFMSTVLNRYSFNKYSDETKLANLEKLSMVSNTVGLLLAALLVSLGPGLKYIYPEYFIDSKLWIYTCLTLPPLFWLKGLVLSKWKHSPKISVISYRVVLVGIIAFSLMLLLPNAKIILFVLSLLSFYLIEGMKSFKSVALIIGALIINYFFSEWIAIILIVSLFLVVLYRDISVALTIVRGQYLR